MHTSAVCGISILISLLLILSGVADPTPPPTMKPYGTPTIEPIPTITLAPMPTRTISPTPGDETGCSFSVVFVDCETGEPIYAPIPWSIGNGFTGFGPTSSPVQVECEKELTIVTGCYFDEFGNEVTYGQAVYSIIPTGHKTYVLPICPLPNTTLTDGYLHVIPRICDDTSGTYGHYTPIGQVPISYYLYSMDYPEGIGITVNNGGALFMPQNTAGYWYICVGAPGYFWGCTEFTQNGDTTVEVSICPHPYIPTECPTHAPTPQPSPTPCLAQQCVAMTSSGCPGGGYIPINNTAPGDSDEVCCRYIEVPCTGPIIVPTPGPTPYPTSPYGPYPTRTLSPTWTPTQLPTATPTPSGGPTQYPTAYPTLTSPVTPFPTTHPTNGPTYSPTPVPTSIPGGLTVTVYNAQTRRLITDDAIPISTTVGYSYSSNGSATFSVPEPMAISIEAGETLRYYGASTVSYVSKQTTVPLYLTPKAKGSVRVSLVDAKTKTQITNSSISVTVEGHGTQTISSGTGYWGNLDYDLYQIAANESSNYYEGMAYVFVQGNETVTMELYPKSGLGEGNFTVSLSAYDLESGLDIADRTVLYTFDSGQSATGHPDASVVLPSDIYTVTGSAEGYYPTNVTFALVENTDIPIGMTAIPEHSLTVCAKDAETDQQLTVPVTVKVLNSSTGTGVGCVSFDPFPDGLYTLEVSAPNYFPTSGQVFVSGPTAITYYLYKNPNFRDLTLDVHVIDAETSQNISAATVQLSTGLSATTDSGGLAKFIGLASGTYTVSASATDYYSANGTFGLYTDMEYWMSLYPHGTRPYDPNATVTILVRSYDASTYELIENGFIKLTPIWQAGDAS